MTINQKTEVSPHAGHRCPVCTKRVDQLHLISLRGSTSPTMCDACADELRVANGFRPMGTRDYRRFHEPEPIHPDVLRERVKKYRISMAQYEAMLKSQNNRCAICDMQPMKIAELVIDHNHETGKVRGLLCSACNKGLGLLRDSPDILAAAFVYLAERGCYGPDDTLKETA